MPKKIDVKSWDTFVDVLKNIPPVDFAYRGESRKYGSMKSKIDRFLDLPDLESRLRMERAVCQRFREHAPLYLSGVERQYLKTRWLQLVVMQHYGAPTRLLDWSKSAWVAAFFAIFGDWASNGYIYGFRRDRLEAQLQKDFSSEIGTYTWGPHASDLEPDRAWDMAEANDLLFSPAAVDKLSNWVATYYCREGYFPRLVAQQGFFTFGSRPDLDHWEQISGLLHDDECFELEIEGAAKVHILRRLNGVGLNGATLFPGLDGIGRSLEGFARAWHLSPRPSQF
jgi:hypothetical protein